jgi:hypothetical protein
MKHEANTPLPECIEGPEAYRRFEKTMKAVVAVPHAEIQRRIEEHRKESAKNPNRRGPKVKRRKLKD